MEALPYPCSPLLSFPTEHDETICLVWPPLSVSPYENATMYHSNPFLDYQRQDREFLAMMDVVQDAEVFLQDDISGAKIMEDGKQVVAAEEELLVMEESSLGDLLLAGAMAVEAGDLIHASAIMAKVDDILDEESSLDRLSCYFARGLRSMIPGARTEYYPAAPRREANRLEAYQMLQEVSPFVKFAHFTANQAILEATMDDPDVHVVDFNVGDGLQWSSLMSDLARDGGKPFHLTALTTGGTSASAPGRWLSEFAVSLGLQFLYDEVADLHELCTEINRSRHRGSSSPVIISCHLTTMYPTSMDTSRMIRLVLGTVQVLQPKLVILTEDELFRVGREPRSHAGATFGEALCHFAAVQESLASCFRGGDYEAGLRLVEEEILGPGIEGSVAAGLSNGSMAGGADDDVLFAFSGLGFRARRLSGFNVAQAKMLAGLFSRGFGVVHDEARLALCWNDRPLTSLSVWSADC
ncbi:unnamed protein product [Alopecurus aequalis]